MRSSQIPLEIFEQIISYADYENIPSFCHALGTTTVDQGLYTRLNPHAHFRKLTGDSEYLMQIMRSYKVLLSGSRAAEFFYPHAAVQTSDWDFYCYGSPVDLGAFCTALENKLGATGMCDVIGPRNAEGEVYEDIIIMVECSIGRSKIQVMWGEKGALYNILRFDCSIVQCFISGHVAVSLYHPLSSRNKTVWWYLSGANRSLQESGSEPGEDIEKMREHKYASRGFNAAYREGVELIPGDFVEDTSQYSRGMMHPHYTRFRSMADSGCLMVDFERRMDFNYGEDRDYHREYIREMLKTEWIEHYCDTDSVDTLLWFRQSYDWNRRTFHEGSRLYQFLLQEKGRRVNTNEYDLCEIGGKFALIKCEDILYTTEFSPASVTLSREWMTCFNGVHKFVCIV